MRMPQFDTLTGKVLSLDELLKQLQDVIGKKEWRKVEHYASLITLEAGEIATREELAKI